MSDPSIQIVDPEDYPLRGGTMDEAQLWGMWHRIVRVMVYDTDTQRYLLQKVAANPYYNGGLWNTSASGHVDEGETYEVSARRELYEEVGIEAAALEEVDRYQVEYATDDARGRRIFRRHNVTFLVSMPCVQSNVEFNPEEVEAVQWLTAAELTSLLSNNPDSMTGGLKRFIETVLTG